MQGTKTKTNTRRKPALASFKKQELNEKKFLRQHPVYIKSVAGKYEYYIPDFYCHEAKLVIEADGPVHLYKKEYGKNRDAVLQSLGLTILRFTNAEIETDMEGVLKKIRHSL